MNLDVRINGLLGPHTYMNEAAQKRVKQLIREVVEYVNYEELGDATAGQPDTFNAGWYAKSQMIRRVAKELGL